MNEPIFSLPDEVFALRPEERALRAHIHSELCVLRLAEGTKNHHFIRAVIPFEVDGRTEPFHWGLWVRTIFSHQIEYSRAAATELEGGNIDPVLLSKEHFWTARIANNIGAYIGAPSTIEQSVMLKYAPNNQRPTVHFYQGDHHPLAIAQRGGITEAQAIEWLKPFHAMLPS